MQDNVNCGYSEESPLHPLSDVTQEQKLAALLETKEVMESGYAGVLSNGNIVDRRDFPEATPIQANRMFNTPAPKPLPPASTKGAIL